MLIVNESEYLCRDLKSSRSSVVPKQLGVLSGGPRVDINAQEDVIFRGLRYGRIRC